MAVSLNVGCFNNRGDTCLTELLDLLALIRRRHPVGEACDQVDPVLLVTLVPNPMNLGARVSEGYEVAAERFEVAGSEGAKREMLREWADRTLGLVGGRVSKQLAQFVGIEAEVLGEAVGQIRARPGLTGLPPTDRLLVNAERICEDALSQSDAIAPPSDLLASLLVRHW